MLFIDLETNIFIITQLCYFEMLKFYDFSKQWIKVILI